MKTRFLIVGAALAGLVIFVWGAVSHTALELPGSLYPFKDGTAVLDAVRAQTHGNGVYFDTRGMLAIVALRPDLGDKSQSMGQNLAIEFATNCVEALLLALILLKSRAAGVWERAHLAGLAGFTAFTGILVSFWNWYGFSLRFTLQGLVDIVVGWYLAGLVLGWLMKKMKVAE